MLASQQPELLGSACSHAAQCNNTAGPPLHSLTQPTLVRLLHSAGVRGGGGGGGAAQRSRSARLKKDQMRVNLLKADINMIFPTPLRPSRLCARLNLEESELIRNVLKSQRREERGDHTVLMNRDGGISSNLHLHLIYPSCTYPPPHPPPPHPTFICLCFLSANFVSLPAPFCLRASICLFSPSYKFLDCLVFISNFPLPPAAPPPSPSSP